jgi:ATP-dependent Clp protease ATP-binding subunit ClpC
VFERFTDRARKVVVLAQDESRTLSHNYIGTEHILLGLIREGEGVAARALGAMGISLPGVREDVLEIVGEGPSPAPGHIPFTPRAKKVLELALREALGLGHNYIGTEHILLGLIQEGEGVAAQVLVKRGADLDRVRQTVIQLLSGYVVGAEQAPLEPPEPAPPPTGPTRAAPEDFPTCPACFAPLAETIAGTVMDIVVDGGSEPATARIAYCGRCGAALGTIS